MATYRVTTDAFAASQEWDKATHSRLIFWREFLGDKELAAITIDDIDAGLAKLAERGAILGGKYAKASGKPLADSTINRYLTQVGSVIKFAKAKRLLPRNHVSPCFGIQRAAEKVDADKYLRPDEFDRALAMARVVDRRWKKAPALLAVAYHTGMRVGAILRLRGKDVDWEGRTIRVARTKNDDQIMAALSTLAYDELKKLPKVRDEELVFGNRQGRPFVYRALWNKIAAAARLDGRVFHELRHGHGYKLAREGVSAGMIMKSLGHRTMRAAVIYSHQNVNDKREIVERVFG